MTATVKDVMTSNVVAVREYAGYKEIIAVMRRRLTGSRRAHRKGCYGP